MKDVINVSGSIISMHPGAVVELVFAKPDGSDMTVSTAVDGHRRYEFAFAPDLPDNWGVTASWEGDSDHEGIESQAVFFSVQEVQPRDRQWMPETVAAIIVLAILIIAVAIFLLIKKRRAGRHIKEGF